MTPTLPVAALAVVADHQSLVPGGLLNKGMVTQQGIYVVSLHRVVHHAAAQLLGVGPDHLGVVPRPVAEPGTERVQDS